MRNGWDYITYQEFERALSFFREAELRKNELTDAERLKLKQGIERAQRGIREASVGMNTGPAYSRSGRSRPPGAIALRTPDRKNVSPAERDQLQLASGPPADASKVNAANLRALVPSDESIPSAPAALPPVSRGTAVADPAPTQRTGADIDSDPRGRRRGPTRDPAGSCVVPGG